MIKKDEFNILILGVGGQGVLLGGEIISSTFVKAGYDVKMSASHGMAQRGESVVCHVRIGKKVFSPLVPRGRAHILVALELTEIDRYAEYLKKDGMIIFFDGFTKSPTKDFKNAIEKGCRKTLKISYNETIKDLKDIKAINVFMLGILSRYLPLNKKTWLKTIEEKAPFYNMDKSLASFKLGRRKLDL